MSTEGERETKRTEFEKEEGEKLTKEIARFPWIGYYENQYLTVLRDAGREITILPFDDGVEIWETER